jgi:uncharacterized protein YndB with AHSA1/START domain
MTHPLQGTLENRDGAWVLTMDRDLAHPPERVWPWLTDPDRLRQWSPIVPDRALDSAGPCQARENPDDDPLAGDVIAVDPPHELVHRWGDDVVRRRLAPTGGGCRLTLEQTMRDRDHVAMNAAGWHICLDVLHAVMNGWTGRASSARTRNSPAGSRCATITQRCSPASPAAGRRERPPRRCCRPGRGRTPRSSRGDTRATAAARAATRRPARARRRRTP